MAAVPLQLAYQAWVTNTRTVLRQQEQPEQPEPPSTESSAGGCTYFAPQNRAGGVRRGHSPAWCPLCALAGRSQCVWGLSGGYNGFGHKLCSFFGAHPGF